MDQGSHFRNYVDSPFQDRVQNNYYANHKNQTVSFVQECKESYSALNLQQMSIWDAIDLLNELTDESDPDTDVPQIVHALQTAEASRAAYPGEEYDWLHLTCLIHDLGKVMAHPKFGATPQWAVVGDTFPVGCPHSDKIVFSSAFQNNPDIKDPKYSGSKYGMYSENCGFSNVHMSWGHDEYMYVVCSGNGCLLPKDALYIIRFHSFYSWHKDEEYDFLADDYDRKMLDWVRRFQTFDLYTKHEAPIEVERLLPYYKSLVKKYFPNEILNW
eukprot:TRINITY_DN462_c0_g2_i1.p1 TRINITY_DN462_c0_g2~~TRINITY_DN462_c0_g2_i1.p1  ORF type:complete len:271 (-),score=39.04 TRINITY_DN462_c0_g2_i1:67-879(-)